ncbi:putative uridylyltransferase [Planctomycetes bacterium Pla163]|uniref:Putative uridylyltransferase n=1 Tax=Rohdeia mirabilis TaxID=2528008 RepID=A0A518D0H6_9BACT|nr:putative uridylyltransferase [Planctomycetes bacterium Pla163]
MSASNLSDRLRAAGQDHLVDHLASLGPAERTTLEEGLADLDLELVGELRTTIAAPAAEGERQFEPPEVFPLERDAEEEKRAALARERGAQALAAGRVGFCLVAGGQASRLGYDGPKGCFPIGPVSERTLFDFHAARIRAAARRHGFRPSWYVMTSPANDGPTRAFFAEHDHFGLAPDDVFFFAQEMLPALDLEGRILLSAADRPFLAPNGHGGTLDGLRRSGALDHARERGIEQLSYFQVDNPLAPPADPLFVGLHLAEGAQMSSKVVDKRGPGEKVGVLGSIDGVVGCIEYSDLSPELREARDAAGRLRFRAGNIAMHCIDVAFVERLTNGRLELPWHLARKRMQAFDPARGAEVEVDGVKFETFVFDALGAAERTLTLEVDRAVEFSPVKNREGDDSPASCQADLVALHRSWLASVGRDANGVCEIDPLAAESVDELRALPSDCFHASPAGLLVSRPADARS